VIPHPVGDPDMAAVRSKGADIAAECVRLLTTSSQELGIEFSKKKYPLPPACTPK